MLVIVYFYVIDLLFFRKPSVWIPILLSLATLGCCICVSSLGIACVGCVWLYSGCCKTSTSINSWHRFHRYKPKLGGGLPLSNAVYLRSELNSRAALEHEQCYPSQLLHQEDARSQHRMYVTYLLIYPLRGWIEEPTRGVRLYNKICLEIPKTQYLMFSKVDFKLLGVTFSRSICLHIVRTISSSFHNIL